MKTNEKIKEMLEKVKLVRKELAPSGERIKAVNLSLNLLVDYIEFMLTPCDDDDD